MQSSDPGDRTRRRERRSPLTDLIDLPNGLKDVVTSNVAMTQALVESTREMKVVADSIRTFSVGFDASAKATADAMTAAATSFQPSAPARPRRRGGKGNAGARDVPYQESPASTGDERRLPDQGGEAPAARDPYSYEEWRPGQNVPTVSGLKRDLGRWLSEREPTGPKLVQNSAGQWIDEASGRFASGEAVEGFHKAQRRANWMKQVGGALRKGEGFGGAIGAGLPTGLMKAGGVAAAAYGVVSEGLDFMEQQRQENAAWRQAYGGGELEAFQERGRARMRAFSVRGTMSGAQAAELEAGLRDLGLRGAANANAWDFAVDKMRDYAMSLRDSLVIVAESLKDGGVSLDDFSKSLDDVTKAARDAGVNTDAARKQFVSTYQSMAPLIGGAGANVVASAVTGVLSGLGPQGQNITYGLDMGQVQRWAGQTGQSRAGALATLNAPGTGERAALGLVTQMIESESAAAITPETRARIDRERASNPEGALSWDQAEQIALEAAQRGDPNFDPAMLRVRLRRMGFDPDSMDQRQWGATLVLAMSGHFTTGAGGTRATAQGRADAAKPTEFGTGQFTEEEFGGLGADTGTRREGDQRRWSGFEMGRVNAESTPEQLRNMRLYEYFLEGNNTSGTAGVKTDIESGQLQRVLAGEDLGRSMKGRHYYLQYAQQTGQSSPVIEALFEAGVKDDDKFEITVGGERRVVTFKEALKNFPDQLASGEAILVETKVSDLKSKEGQSGADIAGVSPGETGDWAPKAGAEGKKPKDVGEAADKYREKRQGDKKGQSGTVTVSAAPPLDRLIRLHGTGIAEVDSYGPPPSQVPPGQRPTGQTW